MKRPKAWGITPPSVVDATSKLALRVRIGDATKFTSIFKHIISFSEGRADSA